MIWERVFGEELKKVTDLMEELFIFIHGENLGFLRRALF